MEQKFSRQSMAGTARHSSGDAPSARRIWDLKVKQTSLILLIATVAGFALGAVLLGSVAWLIGLSLLSRVPAGIHSGWAGVVIFGTLMCFVIGGVAGAVGVLRFVKSWHS
jgi:hypothetical protein